MSAPQYRRDPVVGRWVIIAPRRAERPMDFVAPPETPHRGPCPFCEGHEARTPPEIAVCREPGSPANGPGWRVRVVANHYPAVEGTGTPDIHRDDALGEWVDGLGVHELIVETPRHVAGTGQLSPAEFTEVLEIYRDRLATHRCDGRWACGMLFKNVGSAAGASLEHLHSQLIVTPIVPGAVAEELAGSKTYFERHERCVFCDLVARETSDGERLVAESRYFVAFCPFASRFMYETWIVPKQHAAHFDTIATDAQADLAYLMTRLLSRLETLLDRPAYNYVLRTAPFDSPEPEHYHWHIEVFPRVTEVAGFEWGAGMHINPLPPEMAAPRLRMD